MKNKDGKINSPQPKTGNDNGYPEDFNYPASEDIFSKGKEETDLDPEDVAKKKAPNEQPGMKNEKDFKQDKSGNDLDIPGSELDDDEENVGSEDEENNYYSLGGDDHSDLDEENE